MVVTDDKDIVDKQSCEIDSQLAAIKSQLDNLLKESAQACKASLCTENAKLKEEIKDLKKALAQYEEVPCDTQIKAQSSNVKQNVEQRQQPQSVKPKPKEKENKAAKASKTNVEESLPVDVGRLDFRIGHIIEVEKHPDADSLYVEKVNVNEGQPRTVVSGLVKHMPPEDLQNRMVVLLCNLKPAKMRGITSEAMVMCASTPDKVEVLIPPKGCEPGELVEFEGFPRNPDSILNPKKKIFETCAPDLKTDADLVATYKGVPFVVPGKGKVVSKSMPNVQIK